MKKGIIKVENEINFIENFTNFIIIGDPGCDGLGAFTMSIFAKALTKEKTDFGIILGDIVPLGIEALYKNVVNFIDSTAQNPLYSLCGNHDTSFYEKYFGLRNHAIVSEKLLIIFLDNSKRVFEKESIDFLNKTLANYEKDNILLLFHIPPPNSISGNSIKEEEWKKIAEAVKPFKSKLRYILCGHVHSYFEDEIEGIKLIVSGGGGARIEFVSDWVDPKKAFHHILKFFFDKSGRLCFEHISLDGYFYNNEIMDKTLNEYVNIAFQNECKAHLIYKFYAEDARDKGFKGIAKLFRAASDSEYFHAKNHFNILNRTDTVHENISNSIKGETYEVDVMYKEYMEYAKTKGLGLSYYTFYDAFEAEKVHNNLLRKAKEQLAEGHDIEESKYFTCTSCGYTFKTNEAPRNCPVCGAPFDKIREVV